MKRFLTLFLIWFCSATNVLAGDNMKIKLMFDDKEVIVQMADNLAVTQFLAMLPAEFAFSDFAGEEKITYFPKRVDLSDAPRGMIAKKGKLFIYAPWGNMGFFYKDHGTKVDNSLIEMGTVESGLEYLAQQHNDFVAKIEVMN